MANVAVPVFDPSSIGVPPGVVAASEVMPHQYQDEEIKQAFDTFDLDQNKFVGAAEIKHILAIIGESASDAEVDEMIRMCDADGDGQVTYDEFFRMFHNPTAPAPSSEPEPRKVRASTTSVPPPPPPPVPGATGGQLQMSGLGGVQNLRGHADLRGVSAQGTENMDAVMEKFSGGKKLKPVYIKKLYKKFKQVDKDGSGTIDYYEFLQVMEEEDHPLMRRMFELFDVDKSGNVELKEFVVGLSNYTSASKQDKLKFAFMMFDEDGSGFIERHELVKILKSTFRQDQAAAWEVDFEQKATDILIGLGLGPDGRISYEKFMELAKTQPNLLYPALQIEKAVPAKFSIDAAMARKPRQGLLQE